MTNPSIESTLKHLNAHSKELSGRLPCLFNLVLYAKNAEKIESFKILVQTLLEKFPCRVFFIKHAPGIQENLLKVTIDEKQREIGVETHRSDFILIDVAGDEIERVPFVILPYLVPDLPIYLIWGQDPTTEDKILPYLEIFATRLIFDSDCTGNLTSFCERLIHEWETWNVDMLDINWVHLSSWRDGLAKIFDTKEKLNQLKACRSIQIFFNNNREENVLRNATQALYLQAWLTAQLGWNYKTCESVNHEMRFIYNDSHRPTITLVPNLTDEVNSRDLFRIEIAIDENTFYIIKHLTKTNRLAVYLTTEDRCELPFTLPALNFSRGTTLMRELFYRESGAHYRQMLTMLSKINLPKRLG